MDGFLEIALSRNMKTIDQIYHCQIPGQETGVWNLQCHLRIFQSASGAQTVVVTGMGFELGWFIPGVTERLIDQVVREFQLDPVRLVWIEHYDSDLELKESVCGDYSQVKFVWYQGKATCPRWTSIAPETVQTLTAGELQLASL